MRQVNAVNGSQMVVKLRGSYYRQVKGIREATWNSTAICSTEILSAVQPVDQIHETLQSMRFHPFGNIMLRVQVSETPIFFRTRIKLCPSIHIFVRNYVFSIFSLFCPCFWAVLFAIVVLQGYPLIEPGRDPAKSFT